MVEVVIKTAVEQGIEADEVEQGVQNMNSITMMS